MEPNPSLRVCVCPAVVTRSRLFAYLCRTGMYRCTYAVALVINYFD